MKILSFVVPSYNSEKFLEACVTSIMQAEKNEKLEVIIVNDGSTDNTEKIARQLCDAFPESVRLINQENRGHGGALNTGCAAATGKYLKVLDADDSVETEKLAEFIALLEGTESDVVLTHHYTVDISTKEIKEWKSYPEQFSAVYTFADITKNWKAYDRSFTFHGITYNTEFYHKNSTPLAEKVFYEDHEFSTFPACLAKTITPFDIFIYRYRIGDVSQSVSAENQLKRISHTEHVLLQMAEKFNRVKDQTEPAAADFVLLKIKILLLSYLATVLLVEKNKKAGRKRAEYTMGRLQKALPEAVLSVTKKYNLLKALNRLHISKKTFDAILSSKVYKWLTADKR
ncbi:MAG: glycosyltransferase family 2 protein [Acutalibacteraceae bacterium]|nr:glycosyltransferase family 2 protein [Acutalibacteraceae bacterium]